MGLGVEVMSEKVQVLVTGGCGYIGSHVVLALLEQGHQVVVIDDLSTGHLDLLPEGVTFIQGNCGDANLLNHVFTTHDIDAVIHMAASVVVSESVADPVKYYQNNAVNSFCLIQACLNHGVFQLVFSSTAAVYGEASSNSGVTESESLSPINPYGQSKMIVENALSDIGNAYPEFRYVIFRYFNVAGADPQLRTGQMHDDATHLIKRAVESAIGKREGIDIYGSDYNTPDGTCVRDYIHVSDLADVHVAGLNYLLAGGDSTTLNCGYGLGYSVRQVLASVCQQISKPFLIREAARRPGDPASLVANVDKMKIMLGWQPKYNDLNLIIGHTLAWEQQLKDK